MPTVFLSPILNGWQSLLPGSGAPNGSGFVNVYQAGTTTPQVSYTTSAGNVPTANPIPLSVGGIPPYEIWLTQGQAYKYVVTDSASNPIATYDNISGVNDISAGTATVTNITITGTISGSPTIDTPTITSPTIAGTITSTWFNVTSDGRIYGVALHNNAGAVTGTANQYIASGTYSPTLTAGTNVTSATQAAAFQWMRVGNVVTVSGVMTVNTTSNDTASFLTLSLPISSTFANSGNCGGSAQFGGQAGSFGYGGRIMANGGTSIAVMDFVSPISGTQWACSFTYVVL